MKIMILSDSHSMTKQTLLQFIKNHPASYYIHCGDIYMPYTPLEVDHFYNVRGNNDFVDLPKDLTLDIDHLKFFFCHASNGVNFEVNKGEFVVIVGPSGAGKTTILNLLGGMDQPTSGSIMVDGQDVARYDEAKLTQYRRDDIGFVFQFYNLVQNLTALENVELASQISKDPLDEKMVLKRVELENRMNNFPAQLSGGEQQRVAIARAIAKNPKLLLCDEPTGALDYLTGKAILALLREMCDKYKMTVIVITHNSALAPMADRVIHLKNGKVDQMFLNEHPQPIQEIEW